MGKGLGVAVLAVLSTALSGAEIIDRVAVVVGDQVITESDIVRELRTVALLNDKPADLGPEAKREAAERLVEQMFIRREMEVSRYAPPSSADTDKLLAETKASRFRTEEAYSEALQRHGLTEDELRQHLQFQLMTLRFIAFRFRPGVQVPLDDVKDYYQERFVAEWQKRNIDPPPSFEESRDDIEQILTEQLVDQALDRWMNQQRTQTRMRFQQEAFR